MTTLIRCDNYIFDLEHVIDAKFERNETRPAGDKLTITLDSLEVETVEAEYSGEKFCAASRSTTITFHGNKAKSIWEVLYGMAMDIP